MDLLKIVGLSFGSVMFDSINDVFLATCDSNNNLTVYSKRDFNNSHDIFE